MLGITYLIYVVISLSLTVWVGRTLNRNGKVFLNHLYEDAPHLVDAISNMLLVGFYLINIGFVAYTLRISGVGPINWAQVIEFLAVKIGLIAIVLGVMHFALMFLLQRYAQIIKSVAAKAGPQSA
ncbi:hypothetical protein [uncultured Algimonas sp.]|uniref:hypothetical protein n=1 Tax=uncultured Algimonas sp. TaxID=1547920 RepID=UPI00260C018C|nr:hypothetical protein [uncultured Algimonas sp.]